MRSPLRPWLLVTPLSSLGVLAGHELAYSVTRTPQEELHGYFNHLPELLLLLAVLTLLGASLVERGARIALWPFPAVAIAGFVVQEHAERLAHTGSVPFLLGSPVFLVGLGMQIVVAIAAWLCARILVTAVGSTGHPRRRASRVGLIEVAFAPVGEMRASRLARTSRSRAPPVTS
jgi:hypothetical protein